MKRDAEQTAFRIGVDRKIQNNGGHKTIDYALHLTGGFLGHEKVIWAEEGDAGWLS